MIHRSRRYVQLGTFGKSWVHFQNAQKRRRVCYAKAQKVAAARVVSLEKETELSAVGLPKEKLTYLPVLTAAGR